MNSINIEYLNLKLPYENIVKMIESSQTKKVKVLKSDLIYINISKPGFSLLQSTLKKIDNLNL